MAAIERLKAGTGQAVEGILIRPTTEFNFASQFLLEVMLDESQTFTSKVTSHPVEDGSEISDHVIKQNKKFVVEVSISDATFVTGRRDATIDIPNRGVTEFVINKIGFIEQFRPIPLQPTIFSDTPRFVAIAARRDLQEMYDDRELLTLRTSLGDIENVVITNIQTSRNASKSNRVFEFTLSLEQVQIVAKAARITFVKDTSKDEAAAKKAAEKEALKATNDSVLKGTIIPTVAGLVG